MANLRKTRSQRGGIREDRVTPASVTFETNADKAAIMQSIDDESALTGKSKASIWTKLAKDRYYPSNKIEEAIFKEVMSNASNPKEAVFPKKTGVDQGIKKLAYSAYVNCYEEDINNEELIKPLVVFLLKLAEKKDLRFNGKLPKGQEDPSFNFTLYAFPHLKEKLEENSRFIPPYLDELFHRDNLKDKEIKPALLILLENWDLLASYTGTYRYLYYLASSIKNWDDNVDDRYEFVQFLRENAVQRNEWEQEKEAKVIDGYYKRKYQKLSLGNGEVLVFPKTWFALEPEKAKQGLNIGQVEIAQNQNYSFPNFVFFTEKEPWHLSIDDRATLLKKAANYWPNQKIFGIGKNTIEIDGKQEMIPYLHFDEVPPKGEFNLELWPAFIESAGREGE